MGQYQYLGIMGLLYSAAYLETLTELLLLLINYAETEVDLVGLLKIWLHSHHLREGFFCML